MAGYLLDQQSFYPLYPTDENVGVDWQHWQRHCQLPVLPHILITPSDFKGFVKVSTGFVELVGKYFNASESFVKVSSHDDGGLIAA